MKRFWLAGLDDVSRIEKSSFLRSLVGSHQVNRRFVAVKLLAGVQDIGNAPALIYALGDPVFEIRLAAHNGLRLVSRKFDSFELSTKPTLAEFASMKEQWTDWYLSIVPDAELLD